jgi:pectinesterase
LGYQDTLLAETGTQVYAKSLIQGRTDFIFGQHSPAWFQTCDIRVLAGGGYVTASGRPSASDANYYVFDSCNIAAASGQSVTAGSYYLGRPWAQYARVCWQNTAMSNVINSAGWIQWSSSTPNTQDVTFQEYGNSGAGSQGTRASFSQKISSPIAISTILGSNYASWVDTSYL